MLSRTNRFLYNEALLAQKNFWLILECNKHAFNSDKPGKMFYYDKKKLILVEENCKCFYDSFTKETVKKSWPDWTMKQRQLFVDIVYITASILMEEKADAAD